MTETFVPITAESKQTICGRGQNWFRQDNDILRRAWHLEFMRWLSSLHGWQRLWLVCSAIGLAYSVTIVPLNAVKNMRNWQYRSSIGYDYLNPDCKPYTIQPFESLSEPPYGSGGTCWHIYTSRQYTEGHQIPPTYAEWEELEEQRIWKEGLAVAAFMGVLAVGCSALIYAAGAIVAWILRGFTKSY